jgi:hypothetical protein
MRENTATATCSVVPRLVEFSAGGQVMGQTQKEQINLDKSLEIC